MCVLWWSSNTRELIWFSRSCFADASWLGWSSTCHITPFSDKMLSLRAEYRCLLCYVNFRWFWYILKYEHNRIWKLVGCHKWGSWLVVEISFTMFFVLIQDFCSLCAACSSPYLKVYKIIHAFTILSVAHNNCSNNCQHQLCCPNQLPNE